MEKRPAQSEPSEQWMSVTQAAEELGVNRVTIHRWIEEGRLTSNQVGSARLVPKDEVEALKKVSDVEEFLVAEIMRLNFVELGIDPPVAPVRFVVRARFLVDHNAIIAIDSAGHEYVVIINGVTVMQMQ